MRSSRRAAPSSLVSLTSSSPVAIRYDRFTSTGAMKCERLAIDPPSQRIRTERAFHLSRRERSDHLELTLKVFAADCGADHF
jgi:hypothetical protein